MIQERKVCLDDLGTEAGITEAGVTMAEVVCRSVLWPVIEHTPKAMRQQLFERFFSGLAGALCNEVGPELAKQTLDAVKLAIEDVQKERRHAH